MRRGVGVAGLKRAEEQRDKLSAQAQQLESVQVETMRAQLAAFKSKLEAFALAHKKEINRDPVLRRRFLEMCKSIGVDPLMSTRGFWVQVLGVGDFYYEVAVQVIDVCLRTRHTNGGLLELPSLCAHLNSVRPKGAQPVTTEDVTRAMEKLKVRFPPFVRGETSCADCARRPWARAFLSSRWAYRPTSASWCSPYRWS